jgi:hypothetical protein
MGTSTWHRSPATPEWDRVRELYAQPDPSPREIVSRIVAALDPQTRAGMSDPAVVTCLGVLIEGAQQVDRDGLPAALEALGAGTESPAVQLAGGLRTRAERLIAEHQYASRFGDLALEAMGTTALALASLHAEGAGLLDIPLAVVEASIVSFPRNHELYRAAQAFVAHDLDRTFRQFVSRDVQEFVGGPGLPTVGDANLLEDAVARYCRERAAAVRLAEHEALLRRTEQLDPQERVSQFTPLMAGGVAQGLSILA